MIVLRECIAGAVHLTGAQVHTTILHRWKRSGTISRSISNQIFRVSEFADGQSEVMKGGALSEITISSIGFLPRLQVVDV
jgi:hypothetical protein